MVRADSFAALSWPQLPGLSSTVAANAGSATSTAAYSPLGQEVAREVQQFISQGGASGGAMAAAQSQWLAHQAQQQQLQRQKQEEARKPAAVHASPTRASKTPGAASSLQPEQQAFLRQIAPWAQQAAQRLGVAPQSIMAHAALESAWGQKPLKTVEGANSWNLFGLKAGGSWSGASLAAMTTEYENGQAVAQPQQFRQYEGLDASFADYVRLLSRSPRYQQALNTGNDVQAFAQGLAQGGYATDPDYAQKLVRVSRLIAP